MNIVIVDKKEARVTTNNETLVVDGQKIPFRLIDTLLIMGTVTLSTKDVMKLTSHKITVLLLSSNYKESAIITATIGKSAELKRKQFQAAPLPIAKGILRKKIESHIRHLATHDIKVDSTPYQSAISQAEDLETLLGVEGSFSKLYFGHYFSFFPKILHKGKRSKRPPLDPLNAMMSMYYTIFYNIIAIRLLAYGFETGIGFLHKPFRSHHALASDVLELFRADINAFVYEIFSKKMLVQSDFTRKGGVYLKYEGRKKTWVAFREFLQSQEPRIDEAIAEIRAML